MKSPALHRVAAVAATLLLSSCATLPPAGETDWGERETILTALEDWEFSGRLAVKDLVSGEGTQASVRWRQEDLNSRIRLSGPFGSGAQELYWEPGRIRIVNGDGEQTMEYTGPQAAERFLRDQLGWSFPAESTRFWLLGLSDPAAPGQEIFSNDGELVELYQHGWRIAFERFVSTDGLLLPSRLVMQNSTARLRIVIGKWRVPKAVDRPS